MAVVFSVGSIMGMAPEKSITTKEEQWQADLLERACACRVELTIRIRRMQSPDDFQMYCLSRTQAKILMSRFLVNHSEDYVRDVSKLKMERWIDKNHQRSRAVYHKMTIQEALDEINQF